MEIEEANYIGILSEGLRGNRRGYSLWHRHTLQGEEWALCRARKGSLMATEIPHALSLRRLKSPWLVVAQGGARGGRLVA